jgi:hypothetical protein
MDNFTKYDLTTNTLNLYLDCFANNNNPKDGNHLRWQFFEHKKDNFVTILYSNTAQKTAAIYASFGVEFKIDEKTLLSTQSLDTFTDIDFRGKGLFTKIGKDINQDAVNKKVALVYGFPNGVSIHGYIKKLEWKNLDPIPFLIKPLRTQYFTNKSKWLKILPNFNISYFGYKPNKEFALRKESFFPEAVDQVWKDFSDSFKVSINRDKKYLDWRFIQRPNNNYKIINCYDKRNNYIGFIVYVLKEKHNGKIGYIMELIYNPKYLNAGKQLLSFATYELKKQKADCILAWNFEHSPSYKLFKKEFFIKMPEKIRPIELHFGVKSFDENLNDIIYNRLNWYLSYSDSDTV